MSRLPTPVEIRPQRLNWLAEDSVRRETVFGWGRISLQFAICREIFRNCRERDPITAKFSNDFKILGIRPPDQGAGRIFWYRREEQRGIVNGWQGWRVWGAAGQL